jgi:hypothetical protein
VSLLVLACAYRESCKNECLTNRLVLARPGAVFDVARGIRHTDRLVAGESSQSMSGGCGLKEGAYRLTR